MKCAICRSGTTQNGYTSIVLERDETTLVFKQIPAQICDNCGEEYISSAVNKTLLERADKELNRGVLLEMIKFTPSQTYNSQYV